MTIGRIELMEKKEFTAVVFNSKYEIFIIHIVFFSAVTFFSSILLNTNVYLSYRSPITDLIAKKALTKVSAKYTNFADIFLFDWISKLPEYIGINNHTIELVDDQ